MEITFTVDEENAVRIFDGINEEPFIFQPHFPDGTEFDADSAKEWAQEFINQWKAQQAETQRIADLKESAKSKLMAGEPLSAEEAQLLLK